MTGTHLHEDLLDKQVSACAFAIQLLQGCPWRFAAAVVGKIIWACRLLQRIVHNVLCNARKYAHAKKKTTCCNAALLVHAAHSQVLQACMNTSALDDILQV